MRTALLFLRVTWRYLRYALLLVVALAVGAVLVFTLTERGRTNLAGLISTMASGPDSKVTISGLDGIWSGALRVDQLVLEDAKGPWVAIRGVAVDWSPWSLLSRRFEAARVHADRIELARLPEPAAGQPASSGPVQLPVSVRIAQLDLPDVALGEVLAGRVAAISAAGSLAADRTLQNIETDLHVERRDGHEGALDVKAAYAPAENRLDLDLTGSEAPGGILANLLQLPGDAAVALTASGTGKLSDWAGKASVTVNGQSLTQLDVTHRETDAGRAVTARGQGAFAGFLPGTLKAVAEGSTRFDIAATLGKDGGISIERADFHSDRVSAKAAGAIDPTGMTDLSLDADVEGAPLSLVLGDGPGASRVEISRATIRAFGPGETPAIDAALTLSTFEIPQASLFDIAVKAHSDGFDLARRSGPVALTVDVGRTLTTVADIAPLITGALNLTARADVSPETIHIETGRLVTDVLSAETSGDIALTDGGIALAFSADAAASALPPAVRPVLGERVGLAGRVRRAADGALDLSELRLSTGGLAAQGNALLAAGNISADLTGTLDNVSRLAPAADGSAAFQLKASGALLSPDFSVVLTSPSIAAAGRQVGNLRVTAAGRADMAAPRAEIAVTGTMNGEAISASATVAQDAALRRINGLMVAIGDNRVQGSLSLDGGFVPTGKLDFTFPELTRLAALVPETLTGAANGTVTFGREGGVPSASVSARVPQIMRGDISASQVAVEATVSDYMAAPTVRGSVKADAVNAAGTAISAIDVALSQDGQWTAFDGGATASGVPAKAKGRVNLADGLVRVALDAFSATVQGTPVTLAAPTEIVVENGTAKLAGLAVNALGATARVSGTAGQTLDLVVDAASQTGKGPVAFSFGSGAQAIQLLVDKARIRATGPTSKPVVEANASIASLKSAQATLAGVSVAARSAGFDTASRSGPVVLDITADGVTTEVAAAAPLVTGPVKLHAEADITPATIRLTATNLATSALNAAATGTVSPNDGSLALALTADIAASALPAAALPVLGQRVRLAVDLARGADGAVSVTGLRATAQGLDVSGSASIKGEVIAADIEGALGDISRLAAGATGSARFSVKASGEAAAPDVDLTVTSDRFEAAGRTVENLRLSARGKADLAAPAAEVSLTGRVGGQALSGQAALRTVDGRRAVDNLSLTLGQNRIAGSLDLDQAFVPEGRVDFTLPDLGPLAALVFETVTGSASGSLRFSRGAAPSATVDVRVPSFARGDIAGSDIVVQGQAANYLAAPAISGTVKAATIRSGSTVITGIDLKLSREGEWTAFSGGATASGTPVTAAGEVKIAEGTVTLALDRFAATLQGIAASLAAPTQITVKDGTARLQKLAVSVAGGTAEISGTAGAKLDLDVRLASLPASAANSFAPGLGAAGTISGTAKVTGAAANPSVSYSLNLRGGATSQTRDAGLGGLSVDSTGTFSGGRLQFRATVGEGAGLRLEGGGSVDVTGSRALDLQFSGAVPFSFLSARLAAQGLALDGAANVNVRVAGTTAAPQISGTVSTSGARLVDARSGLAVTGLAADVSIGGNVATIHRLTGTLSTGGTLTAGGTVGIDAGSGFPANLTIGLARGRYTDGRVVTANLSGDLKITGPLVSAPTIAGTINLARTVITIPEKLPGSLASLNVKRRDAPADVRRQDAALRPASTEGGNGAGLQLDLTVNAPQQIFVQGRGLDAELGGSLRLTGPASAPQAVGTFDMRRGRLSILGKRLTFTEGTLGFSGSLVPYLNLVAQSSASDATVTVTVTGPANNPKFEFGSVPQLPEDEVLARLIFNRSMSNLSPVQIAQLASAAASLAGIGGSTSLLDSLRSSLGVDDLDVVTDEKTGNTSVSVGKYLNDRTYVTIQPGAGGTGRATITLEAGKGLKLRGEASGSGEAKGGIFYEKEY